MANRKPILNGLEQRLAHALETHIALLNDVLADRRHEANPERFAWSNDLRQAREQLQALYYNAGRRRRERDGEDD